MGPKAPLASDPGLKIHHPIMSMIGGHGGWLERETEKKICVFYQACEVIGFNDVNCRLTVLTDYSRSVGGRKRNIMEDESDILYYFFSKGECAHL